MECKTQGIESCDSVRRKDSEIQEKKISKQKCKKQARVTMETKVLQLFLSFFLSTHRA